MKKLILLLAICCSCFTLPIQERRLDPEAVSELAAAFDISPQADLVTETQKRWLRKAGQERWEIAELSPALRKYVLDWAKNQGLFDAWKPRYQQYDKALILGATTSRMQMRLDYLKELWNEGVRFKEIVWLTGDRPLDKRVDGLIDVCKNESEAAHILWESADLPEEMRACAVKFIAVPMKQEKRPNTEDTLLAWLEDSPEPCRALFVSDQPFCGYQFAVVKAVLPLKFEFELVGPGVDPMSHPSAAAITLDSIARWIYQEHKNEIVESHSFADIVEELKYPHALVFHG